MLILFKIIYFFKQLFYEDVIPLKQKYTANDMSIDYFDINEATSQIISNAF